MAFHLGTRARYVVRYLGFAVLAVVTFVFALQMTFPYDRVKDKLVDVLSEKYEVTIGDVERGLMPGRMYFKAVTLRSRVDPTRTVNTGGDGMGSAKVSAEVVSTLYIERLEVDLGLLALLRGTASVDLDATIGPGHIAGNVTISKGETSVHLEGTNLPAASLPMREVVGLPMSGKIEFAANLDLPNAKNKAGRDAPDWSKAEGSFDLSCPSSCIFGDGKAKLMPKLANQRNSAFASGGIELDKLNIDSLVARVEIKTSKTDVKTLEVTKFETKSADGELHVDFTMTLASVLSDSMVNGCLRFRGSDALLKRSPKTHAAISTTGAPLNPSDNLFHIKLEGRVAEMRRLGQLCGAAANPNVDDISGQPRRPNLVVQPPEPPRTIPPNLGGPPPPPAMIPPPAGGPGQTVPPGGPPPPPGAAPLPGQPGGIPMPLGTDAGVPAVAEPPRGGLDGERERAAEPPLGSGSAGSASEPVRHH